MCRLAETRCKRAVGEQPGQRFGQFRSVVRLDEEAVLAVADEVGDPADSRADHGATPAERLDDDSAQALGARRQDEQRRRIERGGDLRRRQRGSPRDPLAGRRG